MQSKFMLKTAVAAFVMATMSLSVQALQTYDSPMTKPINGFMPFIPSVGPYLFRDDVQYLASENNNVKTQIKVGDILRVPTSLEEAAYSKYYQWADKDSIGSVGEDSDVEDKEKINLDFEWYRLPVGATTIDPENDTKIESTTGLLGNEKNVSGPTYQVSEDDVGYQIGFRIKAWSERGIPNEGVYLDVVNVAYLGKQTGPTDPSQPPGTPGPGDKEEHPDIKDKPVGIDDEFRIVIKDITNGEVGAPVIGINDTIYVTHKYKAEVTKYDPQTKEYKDATEEYKDYLTWNVYQDDGTPVYEYLTSKGQISNIPTDPTAFANFDPIKTPFIYNDEDKAEIIAKFATKNDSTVFAIQDTNDNALPKTKSIEPNFSEQGLKLKVRLLVD
ncbi:hypothetical protein [Thorsellia kenyensis]|uniref:Uncharacterized protein n=1 Tax=Thorsellia kenyensis TaxID=1549888 RepID=A0ABV6CBM0_9GAMM